MKPVWVLYQFATCRLVLFHGFTYKNLRAVSKHSFGKRATNSNEPRWQKPQTVGLVTSVATPPALL